MAEDEREAKRSRIDSHPGGGCIVGSGASSSSDCDIPVSFLSQFEFQPTPSAGTSTRVQVPTSQSHRQSSGDVVTSASASTAQKRVSHQCPRETVIKWTAFCNPKSTHEVQRYQVLIAVQLSTQAYPTVVKQALAAIETAVGGEITPGRIRTLGYDSLKDLAQKVHRNKQKAKRIIDAAVLLKRRYKDVVPRSRKQLQRDFLGIGDQLGELLEAVYSADWAAVAAADPTDSAGPDAEVNPLDLDSDAVDPLTEPSREPAVVGSAVVPLVEGGSVAVVTTVAEQRGASEDNEGLVDSSLQLPGHVSCPVCTLTVADSFLNAHLDKHFQPTT